MAKYKKVLYLDGDMIIKRDIAELFKEDIEGYFLAACRDVDMAGVYSSNLVAAENTINPKMKKHIDTVVKLKDPYSYFQAGVLLLNLKEMRKLYTTKEYLDIAAKQRWEYLDQDILNYIAQGKVKYLDQRWNVLYDWEFVRIKNVISKAPIELYIKYMEYILIYFSLYGKYT
jgi:lipopolysaccharide biosynthesis glycosyltransferase